MERLSVELDDNDYIYLRERAAHEGRPVASLLKEAVEHLRRARSADPTIDPMYRVGSFDGPADLSEQHDEYLHGAG